MADNYDDDELIHQFLENAGGMTYEDDDDNTPWATKTLAPGPDPAPARRPGQLRRINRNRNGTLRKSLLWPIDGSAQQTTRRFSAFHAGECRHNVLGSTSPLSFNLRPDGHDRTEQQWRDCATAFKKRVVNGARMMKDDALGQEAPTACARCEKKGWACHVWKQSGQCREQDQDVRLLLFLQHPVLVKQACHCS